jgi:ribosome-binding factor A
MRRETSGAGHRHARLQGLIFEELRSLLRDDVSDPALVGVRIRAVVLSVDYRHARVHFTIRTPSGPITEERTRIERALTRATPLLRARLADSLDIKRVPDLRFIFDGVTTAEDLEEDAAEPALPAPPEVEPVEDPWSVSDDDEEPPCSE